MYTHTHTDTHIYINIHILIHIIRIQLCEKIYLFYIHIIYTDTYI